MNDLTINKPEEDNDQTLAFGEDIDRFTHVRMNMGLSRSFISNSMRV